MRRNSSLEQRLDQLATRGSWYGGGSAAALACALAAALLEKLASRANRSLHPIRTRCVQLAEQDALAFARVIRTQARDDRQAAAQALKAAIDVPWQVYDCSQRLLRISRQIRQTLSPRYRSDLQCAQALARASGRAARAFMKANLAWLNDEGHAKRMRRRLQFAQQRAMAGSC